jgi:hypothetical protein
MNVGQVLLAKWVLPGVINGRNSYWIRPDWGPFPVL